MITLVSVYRALHHIAHGPSRTVASLLQQERRTIAFERAGAALSAAGEGALRAAVTPYLDAQGDGTRIAVLFGDALAVALGYSPCGIPDRGGLRLAAFEAPHEPDSIALLQG